MQETQYGLQARSITLFAVSLRSHQHAASGVERKAWFKFRIADCGNCKAASGITALASLAHVLLGIDRFFSILAGSFYNRYSVFSYSNFLNSSTSKFISLIMPRNLSVLYLSRNGGVQQSVAYLIFDNILYDFQIDGQFQNPASWQLSLVVSLLLLVI